jgi:hypothetical protein
MIIFLADIEFNGIGPRILEISAFLTVSIKMAS